MKSKLIIFLLITVLQYGCVNSETISGYWVGTMEMNGKTVDLSLDLNDSTISSIDIMFHKQQIQNLSFKKNTLKFSYITSEVNFSFEGILGNNNIKGNLIIQKMPPEIKMSFNLSKQSETSPSINYTIEKLIVECKGANLSADIYKPKTKVKHPALVLLHGSSTNLKSNYYFYADFFVKQGFEVLIFDKRGSGESTGNSITATYENLAEDAVACLEILNKRETIDKNKIGLWGSSQGAMLLPFVASKTDIPSFLIAISPEINGAYEAAAFSDSLRVVRSGLSPKDGHVAAESHRKIAEMISKGRNYREVDAFINDNARKYNFMENTGLYSNININKKNYEGFYWSGRKYNFYNYWEKLDIKTLCVFGEDDSYVDAIRNVKSLKSFNNTKIETKLFSGASHPLRKTVNLINYSDFDFPRVKDGYLEFVRQWVEKKI